MKEWTARDILSFSSIYWQSQLLQAGVLLDVFTALDGAPLTGEELARKLNTNPRGTAMMLTALAAMGLVVITDHPAQPEQEPAGFVLSLKNSYQSASSAARYLSRNSDEYLGYIIMHHHHLQPNWQELSTAVRTGRSTAPVSASHTEEETEREAFLMGMHNMAAPQAELIATHLDLTQCASILDVGAGPGTYSVAFCRRFPTLRATMLDKPTTRPYAEKIVRRFSLEDRIDFVAGDFTRDEFPTKQDAAWLSHILHGSAPEEAAAIVSRAARALNPGGKLFIQEFMLENRMDGPLFSALFSLNMLTGTPAGQSYTESELARMLTDAGLEKVQRLSIPLPEGCAVMMAVKNY